MSGTSNNAAAVFQFIASVAATIGMLAGCAGFDPLKPAPDSPGAERTERERDLIEDFSERQDYAQYHAALQSWESGDPQGCREMVQKLLERNPAHKRGRQLLADLHLADGSPEKAKELLDQLLSEFPKDAQIHHSLGLLCDATGDTAAALHHLGRAAQLDPENELYRMCLETVPVAEMAPSS